MAEENLETPNGVKGLYFSETLQLRSFLGSIIMKAGLAAAYVAVFVIYSILIWGRPNDDYWSGQANDLGGEVNLTICEAPQRNEFIRLPANAFATIVPVYVGIFIILMFILDLKDKNSYDSGLGHKPAAMVIRFPIWSLFLGLNFIFLGLSGLFFFASMMSIASTIFTVAQWSTILALCLLSVNRLIDPPVKKPKCFKICFGYLLLFVFMLSHICLTVFLILNLNENKDSNLDNDELTTTTSDIPVAVLYGLVFIGILCAVIHWRTHNLSIKQQPVLLFVGGIIAVIAAGFDSYDNDDGVVCNPNSVFQMGAFGFFILNIAGLIAYLFLRGDNWDDKPDNKIIRKERFSLTSIGNLPLVDDEEQPAQTTNTRGRRPQPQNLGDPNSTIVQADQGHGIVRGLDNMFRRATTEIASSRYVTPELGFSATQIRLAEIVIGLIIIAFIVVVIYFSFASNL